LFPALLRKSKEKEERNVQLQEAAAKATVTSMKSNETENKLAKALTFGGKWTKETFPDYPDVIFTIRQILAIVCGLAFGSMPLIGLSAIMM
jgi:hypothetical protein